MRRYLHWVWSVAFSSIAMAGIAGSGEKGFEPTAQLSFYWPDLGDAAQVWLLVDEGESSSISEAFEASFGCEATRETGEWQSSGIQLSAECAGLLRREGLRLRGVLNLTSLSDALRESGVRYLSVMLTHASLELSHRQGPEPMGEATSWGEGGYVYYHFDLEERESIEPVVVEAGHREWVVRLGLVALALVVFTPVAVTVVHREKVLRREARDGQSEDAAWFSYWRYHHWVSLLTFGSWMLIYMAFSFWELLGFLLDSAEPWVTYSVQLGMLFLPPLLSTLSTRIVSAPILDRVRGEKGIGRRMARTSILGTAVVFVPLMMGVAGALTLFRDLRVGLIYLVSAFFARLALASWLTRDDDLMPHAVTVGELRDRVFELAQKLGVKVRQLYVVPALEVRMANAFAVRGGSVILTDFLLRNLGKKEVDGVVAHELAHLRHHHPILLALCLIAPVLLFLMVFQSLVSFAHMLGLGPVPQRTGWFLGAAAGALTFFFVSRRFELTADADAVLLTNEHAAMISGLSKLTKANLLPREWGRWTQWILTHPSLSQRAHAIASRVGLGAEHVRELMKAVSVGVDRYALPPGTVGGGRVFTTSFKVNNLTRIGLTLIGLMALFPAIVATAVELSGLTGTLRWAAYLGGSVICMASLVATSDHIATWGYGRLKLRLRMRLAREGIDSAKGVFVSFAPDRHPRLYENYTGWDVGFVFFERERMVYVGDQTRFEIQRDDVLEVRLEKAAPSWNRGVRVSMDLSGAEENGRKHLAFMVADRGSVRASRLPTERLKRTAERWQGGNGPGDPIPGLPTGLGPPEIGRVTSESPRSAIGLHRVFQTLFLVTGAVLMSSMLFGLSFSIRDGGGYYVLFVALLTATFQLIPVLRYQDPPPAGFEPPRQSALTVSNGD